GKRAPGGGAGGTGPAVSAPATTRMQTGGVAGPTLNGVLAGDEGGVAGKRDITRAGNPSSGGGGWHGTAEAPPRGAGAGGVVSAGAWAKPRTADAAAITRAAAQVRRQAVGAPVPWLLSGIFPGTIVLPFGNVNRNRLRTERARVQAMMGLMPRFH